MLGQYTNTKENLGSTRSRPKRKLHERDLLCSLDNEIENQDRGYGIPYSIIKTKIKLAKDTYLNHIDLIRNQQDDDSMKGYETSTSSRNSLESDIRVDMETEKKMVERHYSYQNRVLSQLMFGQK